VVLANYDPPAATQLADFLLDRMCGVASPAPGS